MTVAAADGTTCGAAMADYSHVFQPATFVAAHWLLNKQLPSCCDLPLQPQKEMKRNVVA